MPMRFRLRHRLTLWLLPTMLLSATVEAQQAFKVLGPSGGGRMFAPAVSPHDPRRLYVTCDMGTFYVSLDDGQSWRIPPMDQMVGNCAGAPAFHPTDPDLLYMPYERGKTRQIRVSRDAGLSWEVLCRTIPWSSPGRVEGRYWGTNELKLDPADATVMFAATADGLFRSGDGGRSFSACEGVKENVIGVTIPPAGSRAPAVAGTTSGVFISRDRGKTWQRQEGRGLAKDLRGYCAAGDPATGQAIVYMTGKTQGVFVSHDSGETFAPVQGLPEVPFRFAAMAETHPDIAYVTDTAAGNWGVYKTTDRGKSWKNVFDTAQGGNLDWGWVYHELGRGWGGFANGFAVSSVDPQRAVFSNAMELFVTRDGGGRWTEESATPLDDRRAGGRWAGRGLETALPTDCVFDPHTPGRIYLTYGDICLMISDDRGKSFRRSTRGIPREWQNTIWDLVPDPDRKGVLYAAAARQHGVAGWEELDPTKNRPGGGVLVSTDAGETWAVASDGLPSKEFPCVGLVLDPRSPPDRRTLYCVYFYDGVYRSTDGGKSWQPKSDGLVRGNNRNVMKLTIASDGALYCLMTGRRDGKDFTPGGLFVSRNGGDSWQELTRDVSIYWPARFAVDPRNPRRLFITANSTPGKGADGIWMSSDGGATWANTVNTAQLGKELFGYIHSGEITFDPGKPGRVYYATKTHGLWRSDDDAATWQRVTACGPLAAGRIAFDPHAPGGVYVCSRGLWKAVVE